LPSGSLALSHPSVAIIPLPVNNMPAVRSLLVLALICLTSVQSPSQSAPAPKSQSNTARTHSPANLSPEQERGLHLLKASETEAAALAPDMRAFVLWRASYAYAAVDAKKAQSLTKEAYLATQAIEEPADPDQCGQVGSAGDIKSWIQERILSEMITKERIPEVEELLPLAMEPVRDNITTELVQHYTSKKDVAHAEALLNRVAESKHYPFRAAADLLLALGQEQSGDRMTIFNQAFSNFEQNGTNGFDLRGDFGSFVERTWSRVPSAVVLEAIDKVLEEAKARESHERLSMGTDKGFVSLNSKYEMRLFQLLPVLQELDKDKAESLLRDDAATRERLAKFPKGMQSLSADGTTYSYGMTDDDSGGASQAASQDQARQQELLQINQRGQAIQRESQKDPQQAINDALMLPVQSQNVSPRAETLLMVARNSEKIKPSAAKAALDEIMKFEEQLTPEQIKNEADLPQIYFELGDREDAKKALNVMLKAAEKLYAHDTDGDDPNKSFKGTWPSADLWRKCVQAARKISPAYAEEIIGEIPDAEIAASIKVAYAGSLLGQTSSVPILVSDCRKNSSGYNYSD
jgi:hypothetical protein